MFFHFKIHWPLWNFQSLPWGRGGYFWNHTLTWLIDINASFYQTTKFGIKPIDVKIMIFHYSSMGKLKMGNPTFHINGFDAFIFLWELVMCFETSMILKMYKVNSLKRHFYRKVMHQSIPTVTIPPPGTPWGICTLLATLGWGNVRSSMHIYTAALHFSGPGGGAFFHFLFPAVGNFCIFLAPGWRIFIVIFRNY